MANVKIAGLKKFASNLQSVGKNLSQTRRLHGETVILYEQWVRQNFQAQGRKHDRGSLRWKKLSPVTLKKRRTRKRSPNTGKRILEDNGFLKARWFRNITDKQGTFTSGQDYSSIHEHGGKSFLEDEKKWINVPQRKIFPEKKQGIKIIRPAVKRYVDRAFKK